MVTSMDEGIGRVLSAIRDAGIESNTVVLFQSDNGAEPAAGGSSGELRGHKFQEWEGGVRSTAVIKWPKAITGGWTSEQLCGYIDIAPTLCAIAGVRVDPSKVYDGIDISSSLLNRGNNLSRQLYLGHGSVIVDDWKLVKAGGGTGKTNEKEDFLFNIVKDPMEKNDVKSQYPLQYQELLKASKPYSEIKSNVKVPPYGQGRKTFKAPREWNILLD
ncbi:sulfatase-like hydrolase/transferase [Niabella hibiscisoli]|uniref:sulfatase-like hydrolase/transferase n=1 Tax=Niabella hibiscisoli TaxID=1825928 RepID=UPI0021D454D1|nr:sulfatase-like hydrolase/transferase [Niabella hibiscisoli]